MSGAAELPKIFESISLRKRLISRCIDSQRYRADRLSIVKGIFTEPKRNLLTLWEWRRMVGPSLRRGHLPRPHTNEKPEPLAPTGPLSLRRPASTNTNTLRRRMDKNLFHRL